MRNAEDDCHCPLSTANNVKEYSIISSNQHLDERRKGSWFVGFNSTDHSALGLERAKIHSRKQSRACLRVSRMLHIIANWPQRAWKHRSHGLWDIPPIPSTLFLLPSHANMSRFSFLPAGTKARNSHSTSCQDTAWETSELARLSKLITG